MRATPADADMERRFRRQALTEVVIMLFGAAGFMAFGAGLYALWVTR